MKDLLCKAKWKVQLLKKFKLYEKEKNIKFVKIYQTIGYGSFT